jgi:hypothetical protein
MPEELGSFLGEHVYDGKLNTVHLSTTPCCRFVSVKGTEVAKGLSWIVGVSSSTSIYW